MSGTRLVLLRFPPSLQREKLKSGFSIFQGEAADSHLVKEPFSSFSIRKKSKQRRTMKMVPATQLLHRRTSQRWGRSACLRVPVVFFKRFLGSSGPEQGSGGTGVAGCRATRKLPPDVLASRPPGGGEDAEPHLGLRALGAPRASSPPTSPGSTGAGSWRAFLPDLIRKERNGLA